MGWRNLRPMPTVAEFKTLIDAAAAAIEAGQADVALRKARAAQIMLAGLPDGGRDGATVTWGRAMLPEIIAEAKAAATSSATGSFGGGMQSIKVRYVGEDT